MIPSKKRRVRLVISIVRVVISTVGRDLQSQSSPPHSSLATDLTANSFHGLLWCRSTHPVPQAGVEAKVAQGLQPVPIRIAALEVRGGHAGVFGRVEPPPARRTIASRSASRFQVLQPRFGKSRPKVTPGSGKDNRPGEGRPPKRFSTARKEPVPAPAVRAPGFHGPPLCPGSPVPRIGTEEPPWTRRRGSSRRCRPTARKRGRSARFLSATGPGDSGKRRR